MDVKLKIEIPDVHLWQKDIGFKFFANEQILDRFNSCPTHYICICNITNKVTGSKDFDEVYIAASLKLYNWLDTNNVKIVPYLARRLEQDCLDSIDFIFPKESLLLGFKLQWLS